MKPAHTTPAPVRAYRLTLTLSCDLAEPEAEALAHELVAEAQAHLLASERLEVVAVERQN